MKGKFRQSSIGARMLLVMGVVLLLQTGLITGSIIGSGAIERLSENSYDIFNQKIITRKNYLEYEMISRWSNLTEAEQKIEAHFSRVLEKNNAGFDEIETNSDLAVELLTIQTRYPLGMEKQLIRTVTGREVPPGQSALDVKCSVFNVATVYMVHSALMKGSPLTHRAVTVSGGAVARPRNLWVPIGTPLRCLLESAGGLREEPAVILTGGPMTGTVQGDLEAPVVKNTNALLCLTDQEHNSASQTETVCVRCGHCVSSCPMNLNPVSVYRAMRMGERERLPELHLEDCMECGCCSYICPSHIPLADLVRQARQFPREGGEQE